VEEGEGKGKGGMIVGNANIANKIRNGKKVNARESLVPPYYLPHLSEAQRLANAYLFNKFVYSVVYSPPPPHPDPPTPSLTS
jgi:hypothetical protein